MKYIKLFEEFINEMAPGPGPGDSQIAGPTPYDNIKKKNLDTQGLVAVEILKHLWGLGVLKTGINKRMWEIMVLNLRQFILNAIHPKGIEPLSDVYFNAAMLANRGQGKRWAGLYNINLSNNADTYKLASAILELALDEGWLNNKKYKFQKVTIKNKVVDLINKNT